MRSALWFLTEEDGRVRQIVNKVVTSLNKKTHLPNSPIGADDIVILWERYLAPRWGQVRNFSLPIGLVTDGATIARNDYYKFNIDRKLFLLIKRFVCETDAIYYKKYYKQLYKGELDFSTFEDDPSGSRVNIQIQEGGLAKLIKAMEDVELTIPFDEDAINVYNDGLNIDNAAKFLITNGSLASDNGQHTLNGVKISVEGVGDVGTVAPDRVHFANNAELLEKAVPILTTGASQTTVKIKLNVGFTCVLADGITPNPVAGGRILARAFDKNGTATDFFILSDYGGSSNMYQHHTIAVNTEIVVPANRRVYLANFLTLLDGFGNRVIASGSGADDVVFWNYDNADTDILEIHYNYRKPATFNKGFLIYDLYKKIMVKISGNADDALSTLLASSTLVITSGDAIRGINNVGITTTFNDFVKACYVLLFSGFAVENKKAVIEDLISHFFISNSISPAIQLGVGKELKISPAIDLMYSSIKVGHKEQESNDASDINGKSGFNGWHVYTTPEKRVDGQMDLQSPWKADPFEMENLRINYDGKNSSGSSQDYQPFVQDVVTAVVNKIMPNILLSFVSSGNYIVFQDQPKVTVGMVFKVTGSTGHDATYTVTAVEDEGATQTVHTDIPITVAEFVVHVTLEIISGLVYYLDRSVVPDSGVPDVASVYNVRLRPSEIFQKHWRWIRSCLYGYDGQIIKFESANRNKDLIVGGVTDGHDVPISSMGARVFIPDYLQFTSPSVIDLQETLQTEPNKSFGVDWEDVNYTGFAFKAGLAPTARNPQAFKLLMSIESDRTKLIA
jgi:hypothetical protein